MLPALVLAVVLAVVAAPAAVVAGEPVTRTVTVRGAEPRDDVFFLVGRVQPDYPDGPAVIQRKLRRQQTWQRWRGFTTSATGRFRQRIRPLRRPGVLCYRVRVPAGSGSPAVTSDQVCLRTFWE